MSAGPIRQVLQHNQGAGAGIASAVTRSACAVLGASQQQYQPEARQCSNTTRGLVQVWLYMDAVTVGGRAINSTRTGQCSLQHIQEPCEQLVPDGCASWLVVKS